MAGSFASVGSVEASDALPTGVSVEDSGTSNYERMFNASRELGRELLTHTTKEVSGSDRPSVSLEQDSTTGEVRLAAYVVQGELDNAQGRYASITFLGEPRDKGEAYSLSDLEHIVDNGGIQQAYVSWEMLGNPDSRHVVSYHSREDGGGVVRIERQGLDVSEQYDSSGEFAQSVRQEVDFFLVGFRSVANEIQDY